MLICKQTPSPFWYSHIQTLCLCLCGMCPLTPCDKMEFFSIKSLLVWCLFTVTIKDTNTGVTQLTWIMSYFKTQLRSKKFPLRCLIWGVFSSKFRYTGLALLDPQHLILFHESVYPSFSIDPEPFERDGENRILHLLPWDLAKFLAQRTNAKSYDHKKKEQNVKGAIAQGFSSQNDSEFRWREMT